jgi:hypothetical protein
VQHFFAFSSSSFSTCSERKRCRAAASHVAFFCWISSVVLGDYCEREKDTLEKNLMHSYVAFLHCSEHRFCLIAVHELFLTKTLREQCLAPVLEWRATGTYDRVVLSSRRVKLTSHIWSCGAKTNGLVCARSARCLRSSDEEY